MSTNITRDNPIAVIFDETATTLETDEKRPLTGFLSFVEHSAKFQELQRFAFVQLAQGQQQASAVLFAQMTKAIQIGFEAGKSYVIGGHVDRMLGLEDDTYRARTGQARNPEPERAAPASWIPVSERLPDGNGMILIGGPTYGSGAWFYEPNVSLPGTVTHWMPCPDPPQTEAR